MDFKKAFWLILATIVPGGLGVWIYKNHKPKRTISEKDGCSKSVKLRCQFEIKIGEKVFVERWDDGNGFTIKFNGVDCRDPSNTEILTAQFEISQCWGLGSCTDIGEIELRKNRGIYPGVVVPRKNTSDGFSYRIVLLDTEPEKITKNNLENCIAKIVIMTD